MIFNTSTTSTNDVVTESKYDASLNGAMMCVYENELNFNRVMEAAGLSELKYYIETGKSLFITEANALTNFFSKIRAVLEKIIAKIKELFNKFVTIINGALMDDKKFVEKYKSKVKGVTLSSFSGYEFNELNSSFINPVTITDINVLMPGKTTEKRMNSSNRNFNEAPTTTIEEEKDKHRGNIVGKTPMTESEFRDALKDKLYKHGGEKYNLTNINVSEWMGYLESAKADIKAAQDTRDKTVNQIQNYIKDIKQKESEFTKAKETDENAEVREGAIKGAQRLAQVYQSVSNDYTTAFGALIDALKKRKSQAKAICVKGLTSSKASKEGAKSTTTASSTASTTTAESAVADIFANVTIV